MHRTLDGRDRDHKEKMCVHNHQIEGKSFVMSISHGPLSINNLCAHVRVTVGLICDVFKCLKRTRKDKP